jgi:hypothetical protein
MPAPAARRSAPSKASATATPAKRQVATKNPAVKKGAAKKIAAAPAPSAPRDAVVARLAYSFAEARGFGPGKELDDWLAAEAHYEALPEGARVAVL